MTKKISHTSQKSGQSFSDESRAIQKCPAFPNPTGTSTFRQFLVDSEKLYISIERPQIADKLRFLRDMLDKIEKKGFLSPAERVRFRDTIPVLAKLQETFRQTSKDFHYNALELAKKSDGNSFQRARRKTKNISPLNVNPFAVQNQGASLMEAASNLDDVIDKLNDMCIKMGISPIQPIHR